MIVRNARLREREGLWEMHVEGGRIVSLQAQSEQQAASSKPGERAFDAAGGEEPIDAQGALLLPPWVDAHVHLDTALTAGQPRYNQSGTLWEGISIWAERKQQMTEADVLARARRALAQEISYGTLLVRSHVDVCDPQLTALRALLRLREEIAPLMTLQIVAFPQEGIFCYEHGDAYLEEALRLGADVVGGIPHYEWTREDGVAQVRRIFDLAEKYDRRIDLHCDETDDPNSRYTEVVAKEAYARGMGSRVTISHTTAMHSYDNAYALRLIENLHKAGVSLVTNPLANLNLQGRADTYPKRRGLTRVKELWQAGVNMAVGHDDIRDPWNPLGVGNMLQPAFALVYAAQMGGAQELEAVLDMITQNSAQALGLSEAYGLVPGRPADFLLVEASDVRDLLSQVTPALHVFRGGKLIAQRRVEVALQVEALQNDG
ncbi:MAG: cytosine deaminase [Firmicutes bacterium]|nr:cytosine deaminase [Bacillota bacterium]